MDPWVALSIPPDGGRATEWEPPEQQKKRSGVYAASQGCATLGLETCSELVETQSTIIQSKSALGCYRGNTA